MEKLIGIAFIFVLVFVAVKIGNGITSSSHKADKCQHYITKPEYNNVDDMANKLRNCLNK